MHTIEQRNTQETISLRVTMSCTQKMMVTVCKLQCAHGHYSHTLDGAPRAAHHPCRCAPQLHCLSQRVTPTSPPHGAQYHTATGCQCTVEASNLLIVCSAEFAQPAMLPRQCTPHQPVQQCHVFHPLVPSSSTPLTQGCTVWSMGPRPQGRGCLLLISQQQTVSLVPVQLETIANRGDRTPDSVPDDAQGHR